MQELINQVRILANDEYNRAVEKYSATHASMREAYAVMLEEFEEAKELINGEAYGCYWSLEEMLERFWRECKENSSKKCLVSCADTIKDTAIQAAAELIQLAAMAHKTMLTSNARDTATGGKEGKA